MKVRVWDKKLKEVREVISIDYGFTKEYNAVYFKEGQSARVIDCEVEQYSSKKDKTGCLICQNDVIEITRHGKTTRHGVLFDGCDFKVEGGGFVGSEFLGQYKSEIIEIVGTIREIGALN